MRAVLVLNPNATTTDGVVRDAIVDLLDDVVDLDVHPTKQRGHATHIVAGAVHEGVDTVFALGGDGTVNEVVQAMAGTTTTLGAIPGGGTNVFARALGLPKEPIAATRRLVRCIADDERRTITLGRAAGRYFGFHAGFGFDAAVVRSVEQEPGMKRRLRQAAFVWLAARTLFEDVNRRTPTITMHAPDGTVLGPGALGIVGNTDPWTYLQRWPLHVTPAARFEDGLDLTLLGAVTPARLVRLVGGAFRGRLEPSEDVHMVHDTDRFDLVSTVALPLQVDGDYAGEHTRVTFEAVRGALRVWAPHADAGDTSPG